MRPARTATVLVAAATLAVTALSATTSTAADGPVPTRGVIDGHLSSNSILSQGTEVLLDADVQDARTGMPIKPAGSLRIQKSVGGGAWTNTSLTTKKSGELFSTRVKANTRYRISYSGGTAADGTVYAPSISNIERYRAHRGIELVERGNRLTAKISPKEKGVKVAFRYRKNGKYVLRKRVSTNSRGRATVTTPSGMLNWEVSVAGTKKYAGHRGYTITYH